jgi:signal transduction histidine kinase
VLEISPGQQLLEIRYTALSFAWPGKVLFRSKLEGLDKQWHDEGTKRSRQPGYLAPAEYRFHIQACNNDGVWNEKGDVVIFRVLPNIYQTWWFKSVEITTGGCAIAAGAYWFSRRRLRQKLEQLERQQAVERERTRIARDIHDDLGASLTRITMLSQSAQSELGRESPAAGDVEKIYGTARELTRAMDEIVWAVNPKHDTLDSLVTYLGRFAQHFLSGAGIRCRLDVPLHLPAWTLTAEIRHNVFLAFKEALNNVVKHAQATEVRISLDLLPHGFVLVSVDNGRGFDLNGLKNRATGPGDGLRFAGGNGLTNMQRRLEELGGRCEWETAPQEGTRVKMTVLKVGPQT